MGPVKAQQTASKVASKVPGPKVTAMATDIKSAKNSADLSSIINSYTSGKEDTKETSKEIAKPSGYHPLSVQQREDWNKYLIYLDNKGLAGSPSLDDGAPETEGMKQFKAYLASNPENSLNKFGDPKDLIKSIQYEMKALRGDPNYKEDEEDAAYLGGAESFGLEPLELKSLQALWRKTRTPWAKVKTSDSDGNPGQYTTKEYYPLFGKTADYKKVMSNVYRTLVKMYNKTKIGATSIANLFK